ncbi:hypothetical protein HY620_00530 [Candidatus Uhrbacteria bacterium]|nr:hypothetical protein [Candidatus Uhrbacteria bacterium]
MKQFFQDKVFHASLTLFVVAVFVFLASNSFLTRAADSTVTGPSCAPPNNCDITPPSSGGSESGGALAKFVGLSDYSDGNGGGYTGANEKCSAAFSDSHVCSSDEILYSVRSGTVFQVGKVGDYTLAQDDYDLGFWVNSGPVKSSIGMNDCQGWTTNLDSSSGSDWYPNQTGGVGQYATCDNFRRFACCK